MKQLSVNLADKTLDYLNQLQVPNRSDYIEELILKEWAKTDCGHEQPVQDCLICYARQELLNRKPRKNLSVQSNIQILRRELCTEWLTEKSFAQAQQIVKNAGYTIRVLTVPEQQEMFMRTSFMYWGVYIAGLSLTLDGQTMFGAKAVRTRLQSLLGKLWDTPGAKAGSVLPSDATEGSKYSNGFDCLRIVEQGKRPTYCWVGFYYFR